MVVRQELHLDFHHDARTKVHLLRMNPVEMMDQKWKHRLLRQPLKSFKLLTEKKGKTKGREKEDLETSRNFTLLPYQISKAAREKV